MNVDKYYGLGHRKEAVAKVQLIPGTGVVHIVTGNHKRFNKRDAKEYFHSDFLIQDFMYPLVLTNKDKSFDVHAHVRGGGISAQAGAIKLGIAKALLEFDSNIKAALKTYKLLTQDKRYKERKKIGKRGARRSPQFTKR